MTITLTREEAQQVLAALCQSSQPASGYRRNELHLTPKPHVELYTEAIEFLRSKLSQEEMINGLTEEETAETMSVKGLAQPETEPVAKVVGTSDHEGRVRWCQPQRVELDTHLYTVPSQREWQGLTASELGRLFDLYGYTPVDIVAFCDAIEAKLREKNT